MGIGGIISSLFAGGVGDVVEKVGDAIHKNVTSDKERMALENEAKKAQQDFDLHLAQMDTELAQGQNKVNEIEAQSTNWFVAGARPAALWVCVLGLLYQFMLFPFLVWAATNFGWVVPPPIDGAMLNTLLFGMLGLGTMRTVEKFKGVQGNH